MFYYILIAVVVGILFFMRKRIVGGLVASVVFIGMVFFVIFLLDWYTGVNLRDYTDLSWYDDTIENPVQVGEDLINQAGSHAQDINQNLQEQGERLDERYGVKQTDTGLWAGVNETTDELESEDSIDSEEPTDTTESSDSKTNPSSQRPQKTETYTYSQLEGVINQLGISKEDVKLLNTLSIHNTGEFEGEGIKVQTTKDQVTITYK